MELCKTCASDFTPAQKQKLDRLETTIDSQYILSYLTTIETYATLKRPISLEVNHEHEKHHAKVKQILSDLAKNAGSKPFNSKPEIVYDSFALIMQPVIEETTPTPAIDPQQLMQLLGIKIIAMLNIASRTKFIIHR